jgi:electron transfer flavoprotein beta subunit
MRALLPLADLPKLPMKRILVAVKRVVDFNIRIRVKPDNTGVITEGLKQSLNPFCEIALEEALRLKEKGVAEEVVVVSIGPPEVQNQLRTALAMGADRAILITCDSPLEPLDAAKTLLQIVQREQPLLVLLGKQAIDDDNNQTGQMLAALWDRPQATFASRLEITGDAARVTREVDAGLETIDVDLPAVVTADLRLNEPRFVKLPDIIKAKKKPLEITPLSAMGITPRPRLSAVHFATPATRQKGVMVKDVGELLAALTARGVV